MQCVSCKYPDSRVIKSAHDDFKNLVQRRRECLRCGVRFSTSEKIREPKKLQDDRFETRVKK